MELHELVDLDDILTARKNATTAIHSAFGYVPSELDLDIIDMTSYYWIIYPERRGGMIAYGESAEQVYSKSTRAGILMQEPGSGSTEPRAWWMYEDYLMASVFNVGTTCQSLKVFHRRNQLESDFKW